LKKHPAEKREEKRQKNQVEMGEGIAGWVAQELIPVVVPSLIRPQILLKDRQANYFKDQDIMCVPIKSKGNILGVLEIVNKTTNEPFTKDDLNLILRIVDHAAIAIEESIPLSEMEELSITDDLTKLFNPRYLNRTLEMKLAGRPGIIHHWR